MLIKATFIAVIATLVTVIIQAKKISQRLKKIEDEEKRHDNIQKVVLEQIDQISAHVV